MVTIKKVHLAWGILLSFVGPTVAGVSAYYQSIAKLAPQAQVDKLDEKVNKIVDKMNDKLDGLVEDVAEIKGFLKQRRP